jgi:riboflavin kinase / FMN adenylyltransferase
MEHLGISFTAHVIKGEGKGKELGIPTMNLNLNDVPDDLEEGVYAVYATIDDKKYNATMHYGPRPTLKFQPSCEVHVIDKTFDVYVAHHSPDTRIADEVHVTVGKKLRDVRDFGTQEELKKQLMRDREKANSILHNAH